MKNLFSICLAVVATVTVGCQNQGSGNAEQRETARRAALRQQGPMDESDANLQRTQQNIVNRDGNAGRNLSGY